MDNRGNFVDRREAPLHEIASKASPHQAGAGEGDGGSTSDLLELDITRVTVRRIGRPIALLL